MRKIPTDEAVKLLLQYGYGMYQEHGFRNRVQCKEIAEKEDVDEGSIMNAFSHLSSLRAINGDTGGGFTLKPETFEAINSGQNVAGVSSVVIVNSEVTIGDHSPIIKNTGQINIRQDIVEEINKHVPDDQKPLWDKIKDGPLLDILVTTVKKIITETL